MLKMPPFTLDARQEALLLLNPMSPDNIALVLKVALVILLVSCLTSFGSSLHLGRLPGHLCKFLYDLPILRNTIPFIFDGKNVLDYARHQSSNGQVFKIGIFRDDIYFVRGPESCNEMFQSTKATVNRAYSLVLHQCFGMKPKSVAAYLADTSGSRRKPIPGSNPSPSDRLVWMTHENLISGLLQDGLPLATERFQRHITDSLETEQKMHESILGNAVRDEPDFGRFFQHHVGESLLKALYGDCLLEEFTSFADDLWEYDLNVMRLAQRIPSFCMPAAYRVRDRLVDTIKKWHRRSGLAMISQTDSTNPRQLNSIPAMMKARYNMLLGATGQDQDSIASTDLALIWASTTNVVPSTMTLVLQIAKSPDLLASVRASLCRLASPLNYKDLEAIPLLHSIYAENLRWGVEIHIPRSAPYGDLNIGSATIPRNKLFIANTYLSHTDEDVWNTSNGRKPLQDFWAERFIVKPDDEFSGPTRKRIADQPMDGKEYFSAQGLQGAWIPFGGGHHACPGRLLAKRIMLLSAAILIKNFDIEIEDSEQVTFCSPRFGFGVKTPNDPVRFRIRRRQS